jgi:hypothetical protein
LFFLRIQPIKKENSMDKNNEPKKYVKPQAESFHDLTPTWGEDCGTGLGAAGGGTCSTGTGAGSFVQTACFTGNSADGGNTVACAIGNTAHNFVGAACGVGNSPSTG